MQGENVCMKEKKKLEYQHMEEKIKEVLNKKIETKRSRHAMNQNETENSIQDFTSQNNKSSEMIIEEFIHR